MKTNSGYDLGSWKCGKGKGFTHISGRHEACPYSITLLRKTPFIYHAYKKGGEKLL